MFVDEVSANLGRGLGFLYIFRRSLSSSLALLRYIKHIDGLSSRDLTQTEVMAWENLSSVLSKGIDFFFS